jgi:hypothetical protein
LHVVRKVSPVSLQGILRSAPFSTHHFQKAVNLPKGL